MITDKDDVVPEDLDRGGSATSRDDARDADDVRWEPWSPEQVTAEIGATTIPWCITAGWAIDLFLGVTTRAHEDIEIAIPLARWEELRGRLTRLDFLVAGSGQLFPLASPAFDEHFQTWGRDAGDVFRLDVFRDPHEGETWICRREPRLRLPYSQLIAVTATGVPYMSPEVVLLFKAKHDREKDRHDLNVALPKMSASRVSWLRDALELVHPGHAWLSRLPPSSPRDV